MASSPTHPEDLLPLTPAVLHILLALADGEKHGYAIMQEVLDITDGQHKMGPGTLYGTIKRMLNLKLGSTAEDDRLPEFMLKSFSTGGTTGFVPDLKPLLKGAYQEHGWDPVSGLPTPDTLKAYGLEFTIPDLP